MALGTTQKDTRDEEFVVPTLVGLLVLGTPKSKNLRTPLKWELRTDFHRRGWQLVSRPK